MRLVCVGQQVSGVAWLQAAEAWNKATEEEKAPHAAAAQQEKDVYEKLSADYQVKKEAAAAVEAEALARSLPDSQVRHRILYTHTKHTPAASRYEIASLIEGICDIRRASCTAD